MGKCALCNQVSPYISNFLNICKNCLINFPEKISLFVEKAHEESRRVFGFPAFPPQTSKGVKCKVCANECEIPLGKTGYCGLRKNEAGKLLGPSVYEAKVSWYLDPLPTNCVGDWVCPAGTGCGYPEYAYCQGPEYGYYNLAVFFHACSLNCLFCQNWHFRELTFRPQTKSLKEFLKSLTPSVSCICYFGGDPSPQMPFALKASLEALKNKKNRILRICWETNGLINRNLLKKAVELSLISGGCIKFDLKAWNENLHIALTGISNKKILENFIYVSQFIKERPQVPLLIASTLLVPGYIDEREIEGIANFIAKLNPEIPYRLLAFYPHFYMKDLPLTSKELAYRCLEIAKKAGLKRISIGNIHLLR
ncbi:MAG: radical SAM protein [Thermodesulfobacteriaceae bacterium]|nr:radical SAM protein [Thermodesulfobacteriaceae bacterium]